MPSAAEGEAHARYTCPVPAPAGSGKHDVRYTFTSAPLLGSAKPARDVLKARGPSAYRCVALLRVRARTILVGQVHLAYIDGVVELWVVEDDHWVLRGEDWSPALSPLDDLQKLDAWLDFSIKTAVKLDAQGHLAELGHWLAERTHDAVRDLRELQSGLEAQLTEILRGGGDPKTTAVKLGSLLELARVANRARERCRRGAAGGLYAWWLGEQDDEGHEGYHQHRAHRDPLLLGDVKPLDISERPWLRRHDLAVRHLEGAIEELRDLSSQIYSLLGGVSASAGLREAQAQEGLNVVVACAAVAFGLPGLVFALFGADVLTPFDSNARKAVLGIVLAATLGSLGLILVVLSRPEAGGRDLSAWWRAAWRRLVLAVVIAFALAGLLLAVAARNPKKAATDYECAAGRADGTMICRPRER